MRAEKARSGRACLRVCVRACVFACLHVCVCVCFWGLCVNLSVCFSWFRSLLNLQLVFAPTILHVLCLTDTAIRRGPLVAVLGQGEGAQPGAGGALAARGLRLVQATVVAALQRSLLVRVLGLAHHREGHTAERLQEKPNGWASLFNPLGLFSLIVLMWGLPAVPLRLREQKKRGAGHQIVPSNPQHPGCLKEAEQRGDQRAPEPVHTKRDAHCKRGQGQGLLEWDGGCSPSHTCMCVCVCLLCQHETADSAPPHPDLSERWH